MSSGGVDPAVDHIKQLGVVEQVQLNIITIKLFSSDLTCSGLKCIYKHIQKHMGIQGCSTI